MDTDQIPKCIWSLQFSRNHSWKTAVQFSVERLSCLTQDINSREISKSDRKMPSLPSVSTGSPIAKKAAIVRECFVLRSVWLKISLPNERMNFCRYPSCKLHPLKSLGKVSLNIYPAGSKDYLFNIRVAKVGIFAILNFNLHLLLISSKFS